jgi:lipopolysaccharide transport system ATP-binding protein
MHQIAAGFGSLGTFDAIRPVQLAEGQTSLKIKVDLTNFASGRYSIDIYLAHPFVEYYDRVEDCISFEIPANRFGGRDLRQEWGFGTVMIPVAVVN